MFNSLKSLATPGLSASGERPIIFFHTFITEGGGNLLIRATESSYEVRLIFGCYVGKRPGGL